MRLFLCFEDNQKSCAIWVGYLLLVTLSLVYTPQIQESAVFSQIRNNPIP